MSKPYIEFITNESCDWQILRVNFGEDMQIEGHSISHGTWIKLIELLGYNVEVKEVSDEDMEEGNY